ncbi:hypothetical protein HBB16_18755 [Pseudonocardia sp. MCCB 268]|nr:hypothetical protein [Pseudonocardia cytotoxica]
MIDDRPGHRRDPHPGNPANELARRGPLLGGPGDRRHRRPLHAVPPAVAAHPAPTSTPTPPPAPSGRRYAATPRFATAAAPFPDLLTPLIAATRTTPPTTLHGGSHHPRRSRTARPPLDRHRSRPKPAGDPTSPNPAGSSDQPPWR